MITFNVHYTCKNNQRHTITIEAIDAEAARIVARSHVKELAYINKVKVVK